MTKSDQSRSDADHGRRKFLGKLAVAGAAGTVAATSAGAMAATVDAQTLSEGSEAQGYHLTEHIQDYYKTARG